MTQPQKTIAEFFAGIGLMRLGLENAGWTIAFANDIDEDKWQMYKHHFGDTGEFIVRDLHKLRLAEVPTCGHKGKSMAKLRTDGIAGCLRSPRGESWRHIRADAANNGFGIRLSVTPNRAGICC